ncbi:enoyl-CoA hydratase/isomerase family protein [Nocardioides humi]|uniref:Enoyl-CoA hydratase-related protein n=1 Tax=Nocardioides humi TaxID=449461 RepID=A0ABN2AHW6_9ACTN|nr:enoyl-CoA hydratase/isomerase family protein [Nocardioides humi]
MTNQLAVETALVDGVGHIRLNRPAVYNALNCEMLGAIDRGVRELAGECGSILIAAAGPHFSVGADLREVTQAIDDPGKLRSHLAQFHQVAETISSCAVPVVVAAQGYLLAGGLELALAGDILVVADDALIGDQHIGVGLIPGGGGSQRLPRAIGDRRSRALQLTGDQISGKQAVEWGLAYVSVPAAKLLAHAMELASRLATQSADAMKLMKQLAEVAESESLRVGLSAELDAVVAHVASQETAQQLLGFINRPRSIPASSAPERDVRN